MIDDQLAVELAEFAELRGSLIAAFGLQEYAGIMSEFALAERTINRIWSASADGYIDEVHRCLDRAIRHVQRAATRLDGRVVDRYAIHRLQIGRPRPDDSSA